ncbi:MAG: NAD(P)/FAD-dependent oxidoreductase [Candidatus Pristimantibacillus sp.]
MLFDCAIIGGGPAGLNAALVLGRARRKVVLFDNNKPRNAVTHESHGFITRDGVNPKEFRAIAHSDISKYPSVQFMPTKVTDLVKEGESLFVAKTETGEIYEARTVILATGLSEKLPEVPHIAEYYGTSLFSCPYCDGWEMRDRPLAIITETDHAFHMGMMVHNWSKDLIVCTNGAGGFDAEKKELVVSKGIAVYEQRIQALNGDNGQLASILFEDGIEVRRAGGFVTPHWSQPVDFGEMLGCALNEHGGIASDDFGRTNVTGLYAAGDSSIIVPAQLIVAAAEGSRAAIGVNTELTHHEFE